MKARVLQKFEDKYTKEIHKVNDVIEITEERFEEILTVGNFVERIEEAAEPAEEKPAKKKAAKKKADK